MSSKMSGFYQIKSMMLIIPCINICELSEITTWYKDWRQTWAGNELLTWITYLTILCQVSVFFPAKLE